MGGPVAAELVISTAFAIFSLAWLRRTGALRLTFVRAYAGHVARFGIPA